MNSKYHVELRKLGIIYHLLLFLLMQDFIQKTNATDASGNIVLGDIGVHLQQQVSDCTFTGWLLQLYLWCIFFIWLHEPKLVSSYSFFFCSVMYGCIDSKKAGNYSGLCLWILLSFDINRKTIVNCIWESVSHTL